MTRWSGGWGRDEGRRRQAKAGGGDASARQSRSPRPCCWSVSRPWAGARRSGRGRGSGSRSCRCARGPPGGAPARRRWLTHWLARPRRLGRRSSAPANRRAGSRTGPRPRPCGAGRAPLRARGGARPGGEPAPLAASGGRSCRPGSDARARIFGRRGRAAVARAGPGADGRWSACEPRGSGAPGSATIWTLPLPSGFMSQRPVTPPSLVNAIFVPSGDQVGVRSCW